MTSPAITSIELEIFGTVFTVRSGSSEEHLRRVADQVDQVMKQIAASTTTVDTTRVAMLAALNLADQLHRSEGAADADAQRQVGTRIEEVNRRLEKVLNP